jgi:hypothetical protein
MFLRRHINHGRLAIILGSLTSFFFFPGAFAQDGQTATYVAQLAELQTLDRNMFGAQGTPGFEAAHVAFAAAMRKLVEAADVVANPKDPRLVELAKLQAIGRVLASKTKGTEAYDQVHEKFVVVIKALADAPDIKTSVGK